MESFVRRPAIRSFSRSVVGIERSKHKSYFLLPGRTLIGSDARADCNFSLEAVDIKEETRSRHDLRHQLTSEFRVRRNWISGRATGAASTAYYR